MRKKLLRLLVVALVIAGGVTIATSSSNAAVSREARAVSRGVEKRNPVKFWTWARVAKARPRDFVFDASMGAFRPARSHRTMRKVVSDGFPNTGSSWTSGGRVVGTTGRVFFAMGSQYYSCSASVVNDDATSGRSLIVTAAHCVYDETNDAWATNWIFVPNYDSSPARFTGSGSFCDDTAYGCWTAQSLVAPKVFADQPSFNGTAVLHDYAFAVVGTGGRTNTQLDSQVGAQAIGFTFRDNEANTWMFGYPAQGRYKGSDLVFCSGYLGYDRLTLWGTYRLACGMTGGASGGPWFSPFTDTGTSVGTGTIFSVTSYGYGGTKALYGSFFGDETSNMFSVAKSIAPGNSLYVQP